MVELKVKPTFSIKTEYPVIDSGFIDLGYGHRHYLRNGNPKITINCPELLDEPFDVRDFKSNVMENYDKLEIIGSLLKSFPDMEHVEIPYEDGVVSLSSLYLQILPEIIKERERKAYENNVSEFLDDRKL